MQRNCLIHSLLVSSSCLLGYWIQTPLFGSFVQVQRWNKNIDREIFCRSCAKCTWVKPPTSSSTAGRNPLVRFLSNANKWVWSPKSTFICSLRWTLTQWIWKTSRQASFIIILPRVALFHDFRFMSYSCLALLVWRHKLHSLPFSGHGKTRGSKCDC